MDIYVQEMALPSMDDDYRQKLQNYVVTEYTIAVANVLEMIITEIGTRYVIYIVFFLLCCCTLLLSIKDLESSQRPMVIHEEPT